ncbi:MAG: phosphomannomutase/phosphoglucomutase [Firmicutes bacterium]|nr:phosphomannomutase/phosphoglucomutase [Bacillota bacterium]
MKDYGKLQNGSDIRGVAIAGKAGETPNLTPDVAADIARGFLAWLVREGGKKPEDLKLAIGRDPRITGPDLLAGLMEGFGPYGCRVLDCGLASTPAMFMATVFSDFACDGTIMITASHLPFNRNGFKFFTPGGGLDKEDIRDILAFAQDRAKATAILGEPAADGTAAGASEAAADGQSAFGPEPADIITPYTAFLRELIVRGADLGEKPLEGMRITVDAGNGAGGFYARQVLEPLGADISSSQFLDPNGMFPNHAPNPEDKAAMESVSARTLEAGADLGLIFDTDVDRSAAVDSHGREIARNGIIAMAAALVAEDHPGTTVVTDSITSRQLTEFLEKKLKLKHFRYRRGYRNVINKAFELNEEGIDSQLAIETSGHAALKENYFLDDGAYLATKIVIKAAQLHVEGKAIDSVIEDLKEPADEREIRIPIQAEDFAACGSKVLMDLEEYVGKTEGVSLEKPNYEGVRINFPKGWCLLRKSLHDPLLPMNIASDVPGGCDEIRRFMADFLSNYEELDQSVLEE